MILFTDGEWNLNEDRDDRGGVSRRLTYWLSHECCTPPGPTWVQRYFSIINDPCGYCGSRCPEALQGMYKMMVYL